MKTGIFYGSTTGTTAAVAMQIAEQLGIDSSDLHDIAKTAPSVVGGYDFMIFGSPTYGSGELQDDWYDFLDAIEVLDLSGKRIAVFGLGDESMSDTFCNAVGIIYNRVRKTGANMVGQFNTFPYQFDSSEAVPVEGAGAVGLLLDEVNHPNDTTRRISEWVESLKSNEK